MRGGRVRRCGGPWGGRGERGGGGGGGGGRPPPPPQTLPPPQAKPQPSPPQPAPKKRKFCFESSDKSDHGVISRPKKHPPPHHHHHRTAYEGRPRPQTHQPTQDSHRNPPPPTKTATPKRAEKKDDRPEDPIVGTVVHVPYPAGVERGTVRCFHAWKYGAVCVEYPGGTTLYEVTRSLLCPTLEEAQRHREEAQAAGKKKAKPPPPQTKRLPPRTQTLPPNPLTQLTPLTPLTPHPDPRRCGTPLRGPMRYEGPDRDPMGHNGHGQHT